jgi:hypothetical protein
MDFPERSHARLVQDAIAKIGLGKSECKFMYLGDDDTILRSDDDVLGPYFKAARWFPLSIDPFVDVRAVIMEGLEKDIRETGGFDEDER